MREPAPEGHKPAQHSSESIKRPVVVNIADNRFKRDISNQLNRLNHPSTPHSVSADYSSVLAGVKELGGEVLNDSRDYIGTTLEEMGDEAGHMHVGNRGTENERVVGIAKERARKIEQNQGEPKKAA